MLRITANIAIDESELDEQFVRSSGPGGQHVNKAATACQLRFDAMGSTSLPQPVKRRLQRMAGSRLTADGEIVIDAREHRSQKQNRHEARRRLADLLARAARPPKRRRKTKPTLASRRRRLKNKRHRGELKRLRRRVKRGE
ncbi:MAG: aminoacyl-tRNA hydrolase [Planctomycetes bacterium]|jgi:ribosome-associated protein|nr:aminoacyl-tRNA hydrolase [Phycisphaerae bacterium]NBB96388.1 aminoacyl-tRNA hydrolase [Planctomycetota bacterium]